MASLDAVRRRHTGFVFNRSSLARGVACLVLLITAAGCAGSAEQQPLEVATGRDAGVTFDGLVRMSGSALEGVWVSPEADISLYTKLMIGDVAMSYKRPPRPSGRSGGGSPNFPLSPAQAERLERMLREALEDQIQRSEKWELAQQPGENVLLVEPSLMDLVVRAPTREHPTQTTFVTSAGEVTLVLEMRDSESGQILARVADRSEARAPGTSAQQLSWSNPVSNTSAVRSIFRRWARIFVARLDTARRLSDEHHVNPAKDAMAEEPAAGDADGGS